MADSGLRGVTAGQSGWWAQVLRKTVGQLGWWAQILGKTAGPLGGWAQVLLERVKRLILLKIRLEPVGLGAPGQEQQKHVWFLCHGFI